MTAAGLQEWVAHTKEEFVAKAVELAGDWPALERLATLCAGLREQVAASPLFDAQRFARHLEEAWWGMWEQKRPVISSRCSGKKSPE